VARLSPHTSGQLGERGFRLQKNKNRQTPRSLSSPEAPCLFLRTCRRRLPLLFPLAWCPSPSRPCQQGGREPLAAQASARGTRSAAGCWVRALLPSLPTLGPSARFTRGWGPAAGEPQGAHCNSFSPRHPSDGVTQPPVRGAVGQPRPCRQSPGGSGLVHGGHPSSQTP